MKWNKFTFHSTLFRITWGTIRFREMNTITSSRLRTIWWAIRHFFCFCPLKTNEEYENYIRCTSNIWKKEAMSYQCNVNVRGLIQMVVGLKVKSLLNFLFIISIRNMYWKEKYIQYHDEIYIEKKNIIITSDYLLQKVDVK